jgi:hypothetical protein
LLWRSCGGARDGDVSLMRRRVAVCARDEREPRGLSTGEPPSSS